MFIRQVSEVSRPGIETFKRRETEVVFPGAKFGNRHTLFYSRKASRLLMHMALKKQSECGVSRIGSERECHQLATLGIMNDDVVEFVMGNLRIC